VTRTKSTAKSRVCASVDHAAIGSFSSRLSAHSHECGSKLGYAPSFVALCGETEDSGRDRLEGVDLHGAIESVATSPKSAHLSRDHDHPAVLIDE
jgi:hypothetical protein